MIETLLSLAGTAFEVVSGVQHGRQFERLLAHIQSIRTSLEKLSANIIYAPDLQVVNDINQAKQNTVRDHEQLRNYLEPIHERLGRIVSSQMIITPNKMQKAMLKDPWEVLQEIRPYERAKTPRDPDMVPVSFEDRGKYYIGWQKQGTMPMLFNCEYRPDISLWLPPASTIGHPERRVSEWRVDVVEKSSGKISLRIHLDHQTHVLTYNFFGAYEKVEVDGEPVDKGAIWGFKKYFYFLLRDGPNSYKSRLEALPNHLFFATKMKYTLFVNNLVIYTEELKVQ
jgi:hypothetical protein